MDIFGNHISGAKWRCALSVEFLSEEASQFIPFAVVPFWVQSMLPASLPSSGSCCASADPGCLGRFQPGLYAVLVRLFL